MEELYHIHKEIPFGYWVLWVEPAFKALRRTWRKAGDASHQPSLRWRLLRWG